MSLKDISNLDTDDLGDLSAYLRKETSKGKRKRARTAEDAGKPTRSVEEQELAKQLKSQLVLGINEVTKALEKDRLRLVLVCRSVKPALMTQHLVLLSAVRRVPALCLSGLSETVAPILNFRTVAAMGFKKTSPKDDKTFDPLVEFVTSRTPPIKIPWLKLPGGKEEEDSSKEEEENETGSSDEEDTGSKNGTSSCDMQKSAIKVLEDTSKGEDFIPLMSEEDQTQNEEAETEAKEPAKKSEKKAKRKKRKRKAEVAEEDGEEAGLQALCVKRTQSVQEKESYKRKMVFKKKKKTVMANFLGKSN
ncbi:ribonuclease P protein subunit p38-like [Branchiostoma floridae]|uniref:Ribonuclease P protein subunit p38-like n=1 Tax=Branchiostoma floridae TaxID=7739 RepID=A0A9J7M4N5_BRAFL|nr:ribonuclease P protein subunit p38-like [Branchiostoma floridae]